MTNVSITKVLWFTRSIKNALFPFHLILFLATEESVMYVLCSLNHVPQMRHQSSPQRSQKCDANDKMTDRTYQNILITFTLGGQEGKNGPQVGAGQLEALTAARLSPQRVAVLTVSGQGHGHSIQVHIPYTAQQLPCLILMKI